MGAPSRPPWDPPVRGSYPRRQYPQFLPNSPRVRPADFPRIVLMSFSPPAAGRHSRKTMGGVSSMLPSFHMSLVSIEVYASAAPIVCVSRRGHRTMRERSGRRVGDEAARSTLRQHARSQTSASSLCGIVGCRRRGRPAGNAHAGEDPPPEAGQSHCARIPR